MTVGLSVRRAEDPRLLTGRGRYVDDLPGRDALHVAIVRSPVAHGMLVSVDLGPALAHSGVVAAFDAGYLDSLDVSDIPVGSVISGQRNTANPVLAAEKVLYVGQPVAVVVAEDPYVAEDAAELVTIELDPLPAVTDVVESLDPSAALLHENWDSNAFAETTVGVGAEDEVFADADVIIRERFRIHRQTGLPLEGRGALARHDRVTGQTTAWISTQSPHHLRMVIAEACGWSHSSLRVVAPDVGGAFGTKEYPQAEEILVCLLARRLGRPVKWTQDLREHLLSNVHAREQVWEVELAADAEGRIQGLRGSLFYDGGAHCSANGLGPALQAARMCPGPYDVDRYSLRVVGVVTNKVPAGAYRGFGVPQAVFVMERLMDQLARRTGIDRFRLRRRNLISVKALPFRTAAGMRYDSGDCGRLLDLALERIGHAESARGGSRRTCAKHPVGLGFAIFAMPSGLAPSATLGEQGGDLAAYSTALVRMDATGRATVFSGTCSQGQGTRTTLSQIAADRLGLDPERDVAVVLGDTEITPVDPPGSISSRVTSIAGGAVRTAAQSLREKLVAIAADRLEADVGDVELGGGRAFVQGSRDSTGLDLATIARDAYLGHELPPGVAPGLEAMATHEPVGTTFTFSAHAALVEIDIANTGALRILDYIVVQDSGTIVNPMLARGQIVGAVAQGIGGAVYEQLVYGDHGEPLTVSLIDYLLPTAADVPAVEVHLEQTAAPWVPGGMKGVAEAGIVGPPAVIANAVADALGRPVNELPLDPAGIMELAAGSGG